jgi:hypothetical protein
VAPGQIEENLPERFAVAAHREPGPEPLVARVAGLDIGLAAQSVGDVALADPGNQFLDGFVVQAQKGRAVERHPVDEIEKTDLMASRSV